MEKSRSKNVNNSRVTHSVDPAVIEENAKKAPDGDALYREAFAKKLNELLEEIGKDICRLIDDVKTALVYEENSPYALENFFKNEGTPVDGVNLRGYDLCIFRSQRIKDEISKWIDNVSGINNLESFVEKKRHDGFIEGIMNAQDNFKDRSSFTNIEHNTKK